MMMMMMMRIDHMMMMMMLALKIIPNIEMFLPHSISDRSTQVLGRGMDTHLRKHWIFVFSLIGCKLVDFFFRNAPTNN